MNCIVSKFKGSGFILPGKCSVCGKYGFVPDVTKLEAKKDVEQKLKDGVTYICIDCSIKEIRQAIKEHPGDTNNTREIAIYEFKQMQKAGF